jgi:hypothetical protein
VSLALFLFALDAFHVRDIVLLQELETQRLGAHVW